MKHILMCPPQYFDVRYVINPWMAGNQGKVDKALAQRQWQQLYEIVSDLAEVRLIEPVEGLPDMVFTANAGLVLDNEFIGSSFLHEERRPESPQFERFFANHRYRIHRSGADTVFEGAGDALFDSSGRLWFGSGIRSEAGALDGISALRGVDIHALELVDPHWYHLDTCFCPLPNGQALVHEKAFSVCSIVVLNDAFGERLIRVPEEDAGNFACNAVAIGNTIILHKASAGLKGILGQRGFEVIETDMSEFLKSGGSCKCLTLEI